MGIYGYIPVAMKSTGAKKRNGVKPPPLAVTKPFTKGKMIPFKFRPEAEKTLREASASSGKTMVRILEELLEFRASFKTWPPKLKAA